MSNDPDPQGLTGLAITYHEMLISFANAGFTRDEAMQLIIAHMQETVRGTRND